MIKKILLTNLLLFETFCQNIAITSVSNEINKDNTQGFSSLSGNAYIYIKGAGFSNYQGINSVQLINQDTQNQVSCEVIRSSSNILTCLTTLADQGTYDVQVQILLGDGTQISAQCQDGCQIIYDLQYTSQLNFIVPRSQIAGEYVAFNVVPIVSSVNQINYFQLGDNFCDRLDFIYDTPFDDPIGSSYNPSCRVPSNLEAGLYDSISLNTIYGDSLIQNQMFSGYDIANDQIYQFRAISSIKSLSSNQGSSQGQVLTISGAGFSENQNNVSVMADGKNCNIISTEFNQIVCEVQPGAYSGQTTYLGNNGLKMQLFDTKYNAQSIFNHAQNSSDDPKISLLGQGILMETEFIGFEKDANSNNFGPLPEQYYGIYANGYFLALASGDYVFYCSSDDKMVVYLSNVPDSVDPADQQLIINHDDWSTLRDYSQNIVGFSQSDVITLEQGQKYYFQIAYNQYEGFNSFSLAVRTPLQQSTVNTFIETRSLEINTYQQYELVQLTLNNITNGTFYLSYNGVDSDQIDLFATDLSTYLTQVNLISTDISMTMYTIDQDATTNQTEAYSIVWICQITDYRDTYDYPSINIDNLGGTPDASFENTNQPTQSPQGTFDILYTDQNGNQTAASSIDIYITADQLTQFYVDILGFSSEISISQTSSISDNGISTFDIQFNGFYGPLGDSFSYNANNITNYYSIAATVIDTVVNEGSLDQFFQPIPLEMLAFAETQASVTVIVNNIPSVCPNQNCYYLVDDSALPTILSYTWNDPTLAIQLSDNSVIDDTVQVTFNDLPCQITSQTTTDISCDLPLNDQNIADIQISGLYMPKILISTLGYALYDQSITPTEIPLVCLSVSPISIGALGGAIINVDVTGILSLDLQVNIGTYQITNPMVNQDGTISFTAPSMDLIVDGNYTINVISNGVQINCGENLSFDNQNTFQIQSIDPIESSPFLQGQLFITGVNFGTNASDLSVQLIGSNSTNYDLSVTDVNDTCITAQLVQGQLDTFTVQVSKLDYGINDKPDTGVDQFSFTMNDIVITSLSANTGTVYGGQTLIISGQNFIVDLDQIQIFIQYDINSVICDISDATDTSITCVTEAINQDQIDAFLNNQAQLQLIFDKNYQVNCDICTFQFDSSVSVSSLQSSELKQPGQIISIIGQGLTNDLQVTFSLDGSQDILTPASQVFVNSERIDLTFDLLYQGKYNMILQSPSGYLENNISFDVVTSIKRPYPQQITQTGGIFKIHGFGLPQNPNIYYTCIGDSCTDQDQHECLIYTADQISIVCAVFNLNSTSYQLFLSSDQDIFIEQFQPKQSSIVSTISQDITDNVLTFSITGTLLRFVNNAFLISTNEIPDLNNIQQYGSISNPTQQSVTVTFTDIVANYYTLYLVVKGQTFVDFADSSMTQVTYDINVDQIPPITSSFTGGQLLTITGQGLGLNNIYVCIQSYEYMCQIQSETNAQITCQVPMAVTQSSNTDFNFIQSGPLIFYTNLDNYTDFQSNSFSNGDLVDGYYSQNTDSWIEIIFDLNEESIALIDSVKFFISPYASVDSFIGNVLQVYLNDTYQDLFTFDQNFLQSGWNTYIFDNQDGQTYQKIRIIDPQTTSFLQITQIQINGIKYLNYDEGIASCPIYITVDQFQASLNQSDIVVYQNEITPIITSIDPALGLIAGGDTITINGTFLSTDTSQNSVKFDNVICDIQSVTDTQIICITGQKTDFQAASIEIISNGYYASINSLGFLYYSLWSDTATWPDGNLPIEGNDVAIVQGQNVILDATTPILNNVIIEGQLIFQDSDLEFHAYNIFVQNGGYLQIGTQDSPIQSQISIIIHGDNQNQDKVLAVTNSQIDIYGQQITHSWDSLQQSIVAGDTTLLISNPDWQVGQQIVVASSSYDMNEAEVVTITDITDGIITVDPAFQYNHNILSETYGDINIAFNTEVALLSRNIIFKGSDDDSIDSQYGAHIMIQGSEEDGTIVNISNLEMTQVGQLSQARYPIYFNQCGDIPSSVIDSVVCHNSYSRFIAIQGVSSLTISNSVAYDVYGHQYYFVDGSETGVTLDGNLGINAKQIWTLTNSDISVANYWISNPLNTIQNCNAAGSDYFGFSYYLNDVSQGSSANEYICPSQSQLSTFQNNNAHTIGNTGLYITKHAPVKYPCSQITDPNTLDQYADNPQIQNYYDQAKFWKCGQNGIQAEQLGAITFSNISIADSVKTAIDIQVSDLGNSNSIENSLIIGYSGDSNNPDSSISQNSIGIFLPRTDGLSLTNINFINFGQSNSAVMTCSTCEFSSQIRQDGATYTFSQIAFSNVTIKAQWNGQFQRDLIYDTDGTFTETQTLSWILTYSPHLISDACSILDDMDIYGQQVIQCQDCYIRKVSFYQAVDDQLNHLPLKIANVKQDLTDDSIYTVQYKRDSYQFLPDSWSFNVQSGETYQVQIDSGIDWTQIKIAPFYQRASDEPITIIQFNTTQTFEVFDVYQFNQFSDVIQGQIFNMNNNSDFSNNYQLDISQIYSFGSFSYVNLTNTLQVAISGLGSGSIIIYAQQCKFYCPDNIDPNTGRENFQRLWSDPDSWQDIGVPQDSQDLTIPYTWNMIIDVLTPTFLNLYLDGNLYFGQNLTEYLITANNIWVRQGGLYAGDADNTYTNQIQIQLNSAQDSQMLQLDDGTQIGNNVIYNTGTISLFGLVPNTIYTRLQKSAQTGDNIIFVDSTDGWQVGDTLIIGASEISVGESEQVTVSDISDNQVTLIEQLQFNHYGSDQTLQYGDTQVDIRTVVGYLNRNIKITSGSDWQCYLLSSQYTDQNSNVYQGNTEMHGAEIKNCGQVGLAAIDLLNVDNQQIIQGSTIYNANSIGVRAQSVTQNILFTDNVIYNVITSAFQVNDTMQLQFQNNLMIQTIPDPDVLDGLLISAFNAQENQSDQQLISNNIAIDTQGIGFIYQGYDCSDQDAKSNYDSNVYGNQAGTAQIGLICVLGGISSNCLGCDNFIASQCQYGFETLETIQQVQSSNMILLENKIGSQILVEGFEQHSIQLDNFIFDAVPRQDCEYCLLLDSCQNQVGMIFPMGLVGQSGDTPQQGQDMTLYINTDQESSYGVDTLASNFNFYNYQLNYTDSSNCTNNQMIQILTNPDISSVLTFSNSTLQNSTADSLIMFNDADESLIGNGCGDIACTGQLNILLSDADGTLLGIMSQLLPNNTNQGVIDQSCTFVDQWNSYQCSDQNYGVIRIDSLAWDQNSQYNDFITLIGDSSENILNINYDWNDSGQIQGIRQQSYSSLLLYNQQYDIQWSNQASSNVRFSLSSNLIDDQYQYTILYYQYHQLSSFQIQLEDGTPIQSNYMDQNIDLTQYANQCGTHIIDNNNLMLAILINNDPNCAVDVNMFSAFYLQMTFSTTLLQFNRKNCSGQLIDLISNYLQIDPSQIQVQSIRPYPTIIELLISPTNEQQQLGNVTDIIDNFNTQLNNAIKNKLINFSNIGTLKSFNSQNYVIANSIIQQDHKDLTNAPIVQQPDQEQQQITKNQQDQINQLLFKKTLQWWEILLIVLGIILFILIIIFAYKCKNKNSRSISDTNAIEFTTQNNQKIQLQTENDENIFLNRQATDKVENSKAQKSNEQQFNYQVTTENIQNLNIDQNIEKQDEINKDYIQGVQDEKEFQK